MIKFFFFFQAEDGIRGRDVTGVQTCALPIWLQRGWALAQADRCRALLLAARGDLAAAAAAAASAMRRAERLELRLELARTLLVAGEIERRGRKKRSTCELLARTAEIFESAGASPVGAA